MQIYLHVAAWVLILFKVLDIMIIPTQFGQERSPISYSTWVGSLIGAALILPVAIYALQH